MLLLTTFKKNILISCDLNFRSNLWSPAEAQKTMIPLMQYVDILIGGKMDPEIMLGIGAENDNDKSYEELLLIVLKVEDELSLNCFKVAFFCSAPKAIFSITIFTSPNFFKK